MFKRFVFTSIAVILAVFSINCASYSAEKANIAVVDVQSVVATSSLVKELKKEQDAQMKELLNFIDKARKEVASVENADKKKALEQKYTKEFQTKKDNIEKNYVEKLAEIDKNISQKIEEVAQKGNYDIVISKNSILYGGNDITEDVKKLVK